jgi:hypothetical protein
VSALRARLQALWGGIQHWYAGHSRRDQRIIAGVLVLAVVCLAYLWGWVPLRDYRQTVADEIAEGQDRLDRAARVLGSADTLAAERESLEKRLKQSRGRLLPGRGGTLGAAALQERTNSLAAEKGITVQSTQVMNQPKEDAPEPYRRVSVRLTLSGELKPFAELVSALEYEQQLALPVVEVNRRGAVPGAKGPRTLSATVEVTGFVLSENAKADETPPENGEAAEAAGGEGPEAPTGGTGPIAAPSGGTLIPFGLKGTLPGHAGTTTTAAPAGGAATTTSPAVTTTTRPRYTTSTVPRPTTTTARARTTTTTRPIPTLPPLVPRKPPTPPAPTQDEVTQ